MEPSSEERLFTALQSLRPAPAPAFAAELDERVAAGFPPRVHPASAPFARLAAWFRSLSPRQLLFSGGATALAAIAIATVVVAGSDSGSSTDVFNKSLSSNEASAPGMTAAPAAKSPSGDKSASGSNQSSGSYSSGPGETTYEADSPTVTGKAQVPAGGAAGDSAGAEYEASESSSAEEISPESFSGRDTATSKPATGPYASGANHRDVERAAEMVLGTEPNEVGEAAGKVLEAVHQFDGIVLSSSVRGGSEGDAGARFDLLIPSAQLSDALAEFSGIAEVRSRHEASNDITAPTNTIGEGLQDSHAKIDALLNELADSETETEREALEAQLRSERRHAAVLKSQLSNLQRRANLSHVSLRIETSASSSPSAGGSWGIGDAFHDAGHILAVAAGVAVVGLAILAPVALLVLLVWLANRAWVRQRRERALG